MTVDELVRTARQRHGYCGSRLLSLRVAGGLTLREVADALGVSQSAVSSWETDSRMPTGERFGALCDLMDQLEGAFDA